MVEVKNTKKEFSIKKVAIIFCICFFSFIIFGVLVGSALTKNDKPSKVKTIENPQQDISTNAQVTNQNNVKNLPNQSNDFNYMVDKESYSNQESLSRQMDALSMQQQAILGQVNAGNNNIQSQLQKMNSDMILMDQRISNLENVLKSNQHMSGNKKNNINNWKKERQYRGKKINNGLIYASSNNRMWIQGRTSHSYTTGENIGKKTILNIDDVKQIVYVN